MQNLTIILTQEENYCTKADHDARLEESKRGYNLTNNYSKEAKDSPNAKY